MSGEYFHIYTSLLLSAFSDYASEHQQHFCPLLRASGSGGTASPVGTHLLNALSVLTFRKVL